MYYLEFTDAGSYTALKSSNKTSLNIMEITVEQKEKVLKALAEKKDIKVIDGKIIFEINEGVKRFKIEQETKVLLEEAGRYIDKPTLHTKLNLTSDDVAKLQEYYYRLIDILDHYDASKDKKGWSYVFVDSYTSGKNSNKYQLLKPEFINLSGG